MADGNVVLDAEMTTGPLDMSKWDVTNLAKALNEELKKIKDPRRRQITIAARNHALAECMGDYEALMATCSQGSQNYHVHGVGAELSNGMMPHDYQGLEVFYSNLINSNTYLIHTEPYRFIIGDNDVFMHVTIYQLMPGAIARMVHKAEHITDDEAEDVFCCETRFGLLYTFDEDGRSNGEITYLASEGMAPKLTTKLAPDEIPPQFHTGPQKIEEFFKANPGIEWPTE